MEMLKAKKVDFRSIALLVVSVMLVMSLSLAGTMAWFAATDDATGDFTMGQGINMVIDENGEGDGHFEIIVAGDALLPGMKIAPNLSMTFDASTTASLLRVSFAVGVSGSTGDDVALAAELLSAFELQITPARGWVKSGNYFYYIGKATDNSYVMRSTIEGSPVTATGVTGTGTEVANTDALYVPAVTRAAESTVADTVLASVIPGGSTANIVFMNPQDAFIRIPTTWEDNVVANATITITCIAEAVQDTLIVSDNVVAPTIGNAEAIFTAAALADND